MANLIVYSKADCPLCDKGLDVALELARARSLDVRKVNVEGDAALYERYRYRIPVVSWVGPAGEVELGEGRFTLAELEAKLGQPPTL